MPKITLKCTMLKEIDSSKKFTLSVSSQLPLFIDENNFVFFLKKDKGNSTIQVKFFKQEFQQILLDMCQAYHQNKPSSQKIKAEIRGYSLENGAYTDLFCLTLRSKAKENPEFTLDVKLIIEKRGTYATTLHIKL